MMIPSCSLWKVVTFFGKEHANWSNINGVMIGWSWKVMFGKVEMGVFALKSCIVTKKIMYFSNLDFCSSINHNFINIGQNDMFYTKKCNYFSRGTKWDYPFLSQSLENGRFWHFKFTFWQKKMDFSQLDFSTSSYHNSTNFEPICMFFTKN